MVRQLHCCVPMLCAGLLTVLAATAQNAPSPPGAPPATAAPGAGMGQPGGGRGPAQPPQNLKALPKDTTGAQIRTIMRQYTGDLGVECEFCHAAADPVTHRSDRASDANPVKETARFMIQMTDDLNNKYLAEMPDRRYADPITCGTCHRGEKHPSIFTPPPRPQGNRPPGGPGATAPPPGTPPPAN